MTDESKPYQGISALEAMQWMLDRAEAEGEGDGPFEKYLRAELELRKSAPPHGP
jgi:hypothetical protein